MNKYIPHKNNFHHKSQKSRFWSLIIYILIASAACAPDTTKVGFVSDIPDSRIYAIRQAVLNHDTGATMQIIECLDSDDPALRFIAIHALEQMYDTNMGYHYYDTDHDREIAINSWTQAYRENKLILPANTKK